ncbi:MULTISPECIES: helix-turn-helix domain-containing protein [unclassified Microcoleus]|uniref:Helix-turn-helix domain protein n=2 Tax=Oscillatoriophycideae TaxID=1301283 RepID=K9VLK2_9CYAN|nr:helix-turn-helix domain protein [Oscillatoria nigro-viridis PCC 7112]
MSHFVMIKRRQPQEEAGESPLKKLRDELGMSQEEFARQIGTSVRTVSRWEAGDNVPTFTIAQMKALANFLRSRGLTLDDLPDRFGPPE